MALTTPTARLLLRTPPSTPRSRSAGYLPCVHSRSSRDQRKILEVFLYLYSLGHQPPALHSKLVTTLSLPLVPILSPQRWLAQSTRVLGSICGAKK